MGNVGKGKGSDDGSDSPLVLTEEHIRIIVDKCIGPHVERLDQTLGGIQNARSSDALLENVLERFGELRSIRNLLPVPMDLDQRQVDELIRIRAEGFRLPDPNPLYDSPSSAPANPGRGPSQSL